MADERTNPQYVKDAVKQTKTDGRTPIDDLETSEDDISKVKGGRANRSSDPCEGGERF